MIKNIDNSISWCIETVPIVENVSELETNIYNNWVEKSSRLLNKQDLTKNELQETWEQSASLYPEFCKIICMSFSLSTEDETDIVGGHIIPKVRNKIFTGDEETIVRDSLNVFNFIYNKGNSLQQIGVNLKDFAIPCFMLKCIQYGIKPPTILKTIQTLKPWDADSYIFDIQNFMCFGAFNKMSFNSILDILKIQINSNSIKGADIAKCYYEMGNDTLISKSCGVKSNQILQSLFIINEIYYK